MRFSPSLFFFMRLHYEDKPGVPSPGYRLSHIGFSNPGYSTAEAALNDAPRALACLRGGRKGSKIVLVGIGAEMEVVATVTLQDFKVGGKRERI